MIRQAAACLAGPLLSRSHAANQQLQAPCTLHLTCCTSTAAQLWELCSAAGQARVYLRQLECLAQGLAIFGEGNGASISVQQAAQGIVQPIRLQARTGVALLVKPGSNSRGSSQGSGEASGQGGQSRHHQEAGWLRRTSTHLAILVELPVVAPHACASKPKAPLVSPQVQGGGLAGPAHPAARREAAARGRGRHMRGMETGQPGQEDQ